MAHEAETLPAAEVINTLLLRSMQRAEYSPDKKPHYGLNYDAYTHFPSPIRRYPDLLVHRTIRAILKGERYEPVLAQAPQELMQARMSELAAAQGEKTAKKSKVDMT